jgi:alkane 1-monooxygenase
MVSLIFQYYGLKCLIYFLIMAFGGIFILELINYIEHYGLRRKRLDDGSYEKVNIRHSWNAPHRISNYLFFKLQRHSDHHENSYKPYQILCSYEDSPQLPHGYLVCLIIACSPSVLEKQLSVALVRHDGSTGRRIL